MKNLIAIAAALLLSLNLLSCSDKEDAPENGSTAEKIAGTYNGSIQASAMGQDLNFDDVKVDVTSVSDNAVDISFASFGNPPMVLPEIVIKDVEVAGSEGAYSLASTEFSGTSTDGKSYSGTIRGYVDSRLNLQMELHYGAMPMPLICSYTGTPL